MKVTDLIIKAGGFNEGASGKRIEVSRRVFDSDPMALNSKVAQVFQRECGSGLKTSDANFTLNHLISYRYTVCRDMKSRKW